MKNKLALLCGASSGIGYATALKLNSQGIRVVGIARREELLAELKGKCKHPDLFSYELKDVGVCVENLDKFVGELTAKYGKFSDFVHSAGVLTVQPLSVFDYQDAINDFNVNLFSAVQLLKGLFIKRNRCELLNVVLVSSVVASIGNPGSLTYAMTKSSLNNLVQTLVRETGNKGIRINSIMPGFLDTYMTKCYSDTLGESKLCESSKKSFNQEFGKPEYAADVIAFLLSKESYWIQGQSITIDGGWSV